MTENEALKTLEDFQRLLTNYRHISKELTEANGMAIQALEKQVPKKPIKLDKWGEYYKCPTCGKYAVDNLGCKYKFCPTCGTEFDWSE